MIPVLRVRKLQFKEAKLGAYRYPADVLIITVAHQIFLVPLARA